MKTLPIGDGLDALRERYPGWTFGTEWIARPSGPDYRRVYAACYGLILRASDAEELARKVRLKSESLAT